MIVVTSEKVYGIDVYTFKSSHGTPYQLTFEKNMSGEHIDVSLVNLLGKDDSLYCKEIRDVVKTVSLPYLLKKETLFFNIVYSEEKKLILFYKFLRWIRIESAAKFRIEITTIKNIEYLEVYITLSPDYISNIQVK